MLYLLSDTSGGNTGGAWGVAVCLPAIVAMLCLIVVVWNLCKFLSSYTAVEVKSVDKDEVTEFNFSSSCFTLSSKASVFVQYH